MGFATQQGSLGRVNPPLILIQMDGVDVSTCYVLERETNIFFSEHKRVKLDIEVFLLLETTLSSVRKKGS